MRELLSGAMSALALVCALFFLRYWRSTRNGLVGAFALAFTLMGLNAIALGLTDPENEARAWLYAIRAVAFTVIIAAIVVTNRAARR